MPVFIIGLGSGARHVLGLLDALRLDVYGYLSDEPTVSVREIDDIPVLGHIGQPELVKIIRENRADYIICSQTVEAKADVLKRLIASTERSPSTLIHPQAYISTGTHLNFGCIVQAFSSVEYRAQLGHLNILNSGSRVEPEARLGNLCYIGSNAVVGAGAQLGDRVVVGAGAVICPGVRIKNGALVAPQSCIVEHIQ
jgi:tetrahydrodipicolinate N-succinyltransferase